MVSIEDSAIQVKPPDLKMNIVSAGPVINSPQEQDLTIIPPFSEVAFFSQSLYTFLL